MSDSITFEIVRNVGVIEEYPTGWKKELNVIAWNGNEPKYDIRDWNPEHTHMSRGITFEMKMAKKLASCLKADIEKEECENETDSI